MELTPAETALLKMGPEAFNEVVNNDIRGEVAEDVAAALRGVLVDRWYNTLVAMKRNSEAQFSNARFEIAKKRHECLNGQDKNLGMSEFNTYMTQKARWRTGALRFKNGVEDKIAEAKMIRRARATDLHRERDYLITRLATLSNAIKTHQDAVLEDPLDTETADENLWMTLDGK
jgi:hypothetical protein